MIANKEQREEALRLVARNYTEEGYLPEGTERYSPLDHAIVVVITTDLSVVATISITLDGPSGLALDSVYHKELNVFREDGLKLAEFSCLASSVKSPKIVLAIMHEAVEIALQHGATAGVIGINPKHLSLYLKRGFVQFGQQKPYHVVNNNPVVGLICYSTQQTFASAA